MELFGISNYMELLLPHAVYFYLPRKLNDHNVHQHPWTELSETDNRDYTKHKRHQHSKLLMEYIIFKEQRD